MLFLWPRIEPTPPALESRVLTTGHQRSPHNCSINPFYMNFCFRICFWDIPPETLRFATNPCSYFLLRMCRRGTVARGYRLSSHLICTITLLLSPFLRRGPERYSDSCKVTPGGGGGGLGEMAKLGSELRSVLILTTLSHLFSHLTPWDCMNT